MYSLHSGVVQNIVLQYLLSYNKYIHSVIIDVVSKEYLINVENVIIIE